MVDLFEYSFPIKIYRKKLDDIDNNLIKNEIQGCSKDILGFIKDNNFNQENQPFFSDPTFRSNFIEEQNLFHLKNQILNCSNDYLHEYNSLSSSLSFKRSWVTYCQKNSWGHLHNHNDCMISGVYYYKVDDFSGNLRLYSPLQFTHGFNNNYLDIKPEEGSISRMDGA